MRTEKEITDKIKFLKSEMEDIMAGKYGFGGMAHIEKIEGYTTALRWVVDMSICDEIDADGKVIKKL